MTHYRAQPEDDAVLIVLCAVRDGQFGKSALNEVIDLWVAGQIGRTYEPPGVVDRLAAALRDEFSAWIAGHPNAGVFDWNVAAVNVLRAANPPGAVSREHAVQAIGWLSAEVAVHGAPSLGPEWLELWERALTATGGQ
jgi:hypothetical protein